MMVHILFVILLVCQTIQLCAYECEVAIAAIFQNEAPYLKEWIEYHRLIGVSHFWLYNDVSSDNWAEVLQPYVKEGIVEVFDWSECRKRIGKWPEIQIEAYKDAVKRALGRAKWLALIDTDEFILPMKNKTIQGCLKRYYPDAKAIYVQWLVFGTSGIWLQENESMIRQLICCSNKQHAWNSVGKTIVRPENVLIEKIWCVHHVPLKRFKNYLSGSGEMIPMVDFDLHMNAHQGKYIRINHYFFRDEKFYREVKIPRKLKRDMSLRELSTLYDVCSEEKDHAILNLVQEI